MSASVHCLAPTNGHMQKRSVYGCCFQVNPYKISTLYQQNHRKLHRLYAVFWCSIRYPHHVTSVRKINLKYIYLDIQHHRIQKLNQTSSTHIHSIIVQQLHLNRLLTHILFSAYFWYNLHTLKIQPCVTASATKWPQCKPKWCLIYVHSTVMFVLVLTHHTRDYSSYTVIEVLLLM